MLSDMGTNMKRFTCSLHLGLVAKGRFVDLQSLFMGLHRQADNGLQSYPLQLWIKALFNPRQTTLSLPGLREVL